MTLRTLGGSLYFTEMYGFIMIGRMVKSTQSNPLIKLSHQVLTPPE
jgi:hypothetical protein